MQAYEQTPVSTAPHPQKVCERFIGEVYSSLKSTHLKDFFHLINNFHLHIKFAKEEERKGELAFLETLLKRKKKRFLN